MCVVGSVDGHRTINPIYKYSRRKCNCCGKRATHTGCGDGVALMSGCEWYVRLWVRGGYEAIHNIPNYWERKAS